MENTAIQDGLREKAQLGDPLAQFELGVCYYCGNEVEIDVAEALRWFELAAHQGHVKAQFNTAVIYDLSKSEADKSKAIFWYQKAATLGDPLAMNNLGLKLARGEDVQKNAKHALFLFDQAVKMGVVEAFFNLAVMLSLGDGVEKNMDAAERLLEFAADNGHSISLEYLARMRAGRELTASGRQLH